MSNEGAKRMGEQPRVSQVYHIDELLGQFRELLTRKQYSPSTVQLYQGAIGGLGRYLKEMGIERLQDVELRHLEAYRLRLVEGGLQPSSVGIYLQGIRQFFAYLEAALHLFHNPAAELATVPTPRKLLTVPTEEEMQRVVEHPDVGTPLGVRDRALLEVAYGTAARIRELSRMRVQSVDLAERTARLWGKGNKERVVPLGTSAAHWPDQYLAHGRPRLLNGAGSDVLWISRQATPLSYPALLVAIRAHTRAARIRTPITPHGIRRACATHMLRRGADPILIQQLLGHSSMQVLSQYLQVTICELKRMHRRTRPGK